MTTLCNPGIVNMDDVRMKSYWYLFTSLEAKLLQTCILYCVSCHTSRHLKAASEIFMSAIPSIKTVTVTWEESCNKEEMYFLILPCNLVHSKKKSTSEHLFLVLQVVTNRVLYSVPGKMDPKIPIVVLPGTIWSFQVLNRVLYLWQPEAPKKGALKYFFS